MSWFHDMVNNLLQWIEGLGYFGIIIGLMLEVIPSEIVLGYAGYLVSDAGGNQFTFIGAVVAGTIGAVIQQWILYGIGRYAGRPFFEKYGKLLKSRPKQLDIAENWFKQYGARHRVYRPFRSRYASSDFDSGGHGAHVVWLFTLLTPRLSSMVAPVRLFGSKLGDQWENIDEKAAPYVQPAILVALALLIGLYLV